MVRCSRDTEPCLAYPRERDPGKRIGGAGLDQFIRWASERGAAAVIVAAQLDKPPTGPDWTFEIKFDGIRAFAIIERGALTIVSRRGTPMTSWFPELSAIGDLIGAPDA